MWYNLADIALYFSEEMVAEVMIPQGNYIRCVLLAISVLLLSSCAVHHGSGTPSKSKERVWSAHSLSMRAQSFPGTLAHYIPKAETVKKIPKHFVQYFSKPAVQPKVVRPLTHSGMSCHQVQAGDTLYHIAQIFHVDYRYLAKEHALLPPYNLVIGSKLCVVPPSIVPSKKTTVKPQSEPNFPHQQIATLAHQKKWAWPLQGGKVITHFVAGSKMKQGIDIVSMQHHLALAAQSGKVIYAGAGLKADDKLVIIKHTNGLLTAYANNDRLYVKEGDVVEKGEVISRVLLKNKQYVLHFEVRRNGSAVDPLRYLRGNP